jgi:hypothetical protein
LLGLDVLMPPLPAQFYSPRNLNFVVANSALAKYFKFSRVQISDITSNKYVLIYGIFYFIMCVLCSSGTLWATGPTWIVLAGTYWHLNTTRLEMAWGWKQINNIAALPLQCITTNWHVEHGVVVPPRRCWGSIAIAPFYPCYGHHWHRSPSAVLFWCKLHTIHWPHGEQEPRFKWPWTSMLTPNSLESRLLFPPPGAKADSFREAHRTIKVVKKDTGMCGEVVIYWVNRP